MPAPNWVFDSSLRKYLSENGKHISFDRIRGVWEICSGADPIVFAIDKSVDVSNSSFDKMLCRIGLCFGPELPLDFFTSKGLNPVKTNGFKSINKTFKTD